MSKDEMRKILSEHLATFRTWGYAQLAERVERDRQAHDCLEHVEGIAPDGTQYQMEFQALWDDKPHGDVRVLGDLSAQPQKPLLGFIPVYTPDVTDSFIMSPDGRFVGEHETPVANHSPEPTWLGASVLRLSVLVRHVTVPTWLSFGR